MSSELCWWKQSCRTSYQTAAVCLFKILRAATCNHIFESLETLQSFRKGYINVLPYNPRCRGATLDLSPVKMKVESRHKRMHVCHRATKTERRRFPKWQVKEKELRWWRRFQSPLSTKSAGNKHALLVGFFWLWTVTRLLAVAMLLKLSVTPQGDTIEGRAEKLSISALN